MSMPERYHPECPPDAHKVIRPPETEVKASLCVKVLDTEEKFGMVNVVEILSLMSKSPAILCSSKMKQLILDNIPNEDFKPSFVVVVDSDPKKAYLTYPDGAQGSTTDYYDLSNGKDDCAVFLDLLDKKCLICLDTLSMFTLRSVSTVYPWDRLLANQFLGQYVTASKALTPEDVELLYDVRYGRFDPFDVEGKSATAYKFLRLERKLFLQYPTEDD